MKNYLNLISTLILLVFFIACNKDDNSGTLKVINQRDCIFNIFEGTSSGSLIGTVLENETKNFVINIGDLDSEGSFYYADPQDECEGFSGEQFNIVIEDGETTTILLD
ncbi:hypothetical protein ULMS_17090 [Patiriisocius marinistellae]|uniref:Lipoprotein n=1 Tax=Patiriisocius marinistellae TaxID=2494560 RepID=A0A5J4G258_9FLAO|nr:hypothetical protein [Patiriisocius marinistellae]GEQ86201.1 hypothetical protein ULMS_17090 [Patiriisocius marinistellae]